MSLRKIITEEYLQSINYDNFQDIIDELINAKISSIEIPHLDITTTRNRFVINIFFITIINKYNLVLTKEVFMLGQVNNKIIHEKFSVLYELGIESGLVQDSLYNMKWDFWFCFNYINNFVLEHCQKYHKSLCLKDLIDLRNHPTIKEIINTKIDEHRGIRFQEIQIGEIRKKLINTLAELDVPCNTLKPFIKLNLLNEIQVTHILHEVSFRTDINDNVLKTRIRGNYLNGLNDPLEYALESLSCKKSLIYSKIAIRDVSYFNRALQILLMDIKHIYRGDCGCDSFTPIMITEETHKHVIGKNFISGSNIIEITKANAPSYIGKILNIRTADKCLYKDGVCEVCGGRIIKYYINSKFNLGFVIAGSFSSNTVQEILSARHFSSTDTISYTIPTELKLDFKKVGSSLFFRSKVNKDKLFVGFESKNCNYILNLSSSKYNSSSDINEATFGKFSSISLIRGDDVKDVEIRQNKRSLYLSKEFLFYIQQNFDKIINKDEKMLIPVGDFLTANPIFNIISVNDSVVFYVSQIIKFLEYQITGKTVTEALNDFINIAYPRTNINILILEIVLKAYNCKSKIDMTLNTSDNPYYLNGLKIINQYRSIASSLAFERHGQFLNSSLYYLLPREKSVFDALISRE